MVGEGPIGRRFEMAVVASEETAAVLAQHAGRNGVVRRQVLIERHPVAEDDGRLVADAQVTHNPLQFADDNGNRFVDDVDAIQMPFRFQVNPHRIAIQLADTAQTAKISRRHRR